MNKSFEFFDRAIRARPFNLYAAAGVGSVLADMKEMTMARDIYTQVFCNSFLSKVQEVAPLYHITINLAFIMMDLGQFQQGATLVINFKFIIAGKSNKEKE